MTKEEFRATLVPYTNSTGFYTIDANAILPKGCYGLASFATYYDGYWAWGLDAGYHGARWSRESERPLHSFEEAYDDFIDVLSSEGYISID